MSNILEAMLFAVGEEGLSIDEISSILEEEKEKIAEELKLLEEKYEDRGIELKLLGNKYKLVTKEEYKDYIKKLTDEDLGKIISKKFNLESINDISKLNHMEKIDFIKK